MAKKSKLASIVVCLALAMASMAGVPMRADEVERLMRDMSRPKIVQTISGGKDEEEAEPGSEADPV